MQIPTDLKYSKEHTWLKLLVGNIALIDITEFAQSELGEIVYVDLPSVGSSFVKDEVFGSVEALKTTSDLFVPVSGEVVETNKAVVANPGLANSSSQQDGWIIKIRMTDITEQDLLFDATGYAGLVS